MAGGRRPSSYVSTARSNPTNDRQPEQSPLHTSPALASTVSPSLPAWIPSIWQPPPLKSPIASTGDAPRDPPFYPLPAPNPSSALALALDTAVKSAVVRALGASNCNNAATISHVTNSSCKSDNGVDEDSSLLLTSRENQLLDLVAVLNSRLHHKNDQTTQLNDRILALEQKLTKQNQFNQLRYETLQSDSKALQKQCLHTSSTMSSNLHSTLDSLTNQITCTNSSISKLSLAQKRIESDVTAFSRRTKNISNDVLQTRTSINHQLEKQSSKIQQLDQALATCNERMSELISDSISKPTVHQLQTKIESAVEDISTMRSKNKRIESQITDLAKNTEESIALGTGLQQSIRERLGQIAKKVTSLQTATEADQLASSQHVDTVTLKQHQATNHKVSRKVDVLESNLKALKKLIESNLRTQWNAENIVKEQVSLITKHVCVAMRQYTARRISENNVLIDKALRARIPDYAQKDDQFVLVREEDVDGNESVDIHRSPNPPSHSGS